MKKADTHILSKFLVAVIKFTRKMANQDVELEIIVRIFKSNGHNG